MIIYEGPSMIDGSDIVCIATTNSKNIKTGSMIQTWIMRQDENPQTSIHNGNDVSMCGNCPLRGRIVEGSKYPTRNMGRACYVNVAQAPNSIWKAYRAGKYPKANKLWFAGRMLRLGSYGEPVAVPLKVWHPYIKKAINHTGYTHQWENKKFGAWKKYIQASVETEDQKEKANKMGWHTFRMGENKLKDETICLNKTKNIQCVNCMLCNGKKNIVIPPHGNQNTKRYALELVG